MTTRNELFEPLVALATGLAAALALVDTSSATLQESAVLLALIALVVSLQPRRWIWAMAAIVAGWWLAVLAVKFLPEVLNPVPSVAQAVGGAAMFNTPYEGPEIAALLSVAIPALIMVALTTRSLTRPARRLDPEASRQSPQTNAAASSSRMPALPRGPIVVVIGTAILAFTLVPDLMAYLQQESTPLPYSWDTSNHVAWQALIEWGLVPMKDFFYPYGFQWLFSLRSFGPGFAWLAQIAMLTISGWSLWRLSGRRTWCVLACLLALVLAGAWGGAPFWRWLPALLIPVTYAALGPARHARMGSGHLVFGATCLLAALIEPDLLGLGLAGAILMLVGDFVRASSRGEEGA